MYIKIDLSCQGVSGDPLQMGPTKAQVQRFKKFPWFDIWAKSVLVSVPYRLPFTHLRFPQKCVFGPLPRRFKDRFPLEVFPLTGEGKTDQPGPR